MGVLGLMRERFFPASSLRVQVLSDLHLEVGQQYTSYTFPTSAPLLLLAGDIGRLKDYNSYLHFLHAQVTRYAKVFLVLGNHEFYDLEYEEGLVIAQRLTTEPSLADKVILLHRAYWDYPESNLTIIGCTLWSALPCEVHEIVAAKVKDFTKIKQWTPEKHNQIHIEEVDWLREQVATLHLAGRRLLVATHHAPCIEDTSRPEHVANPWTAAFATDILQQPGAWNGVGTWVFGHTHYSTEFLRKGIRIIANQRGYVLPGSVTAQEEKEAEGRRKKKKRADSHVFNANGNGHGREEEAAGSNA
ncbi:hypothetical protein QTJ16_000733 [Diplocarpon rosae]|uniref:Calcineurin-like phosphoesterase domain-containing protein n=1 Tax=Diplocarpon rosae TaxID=946125 RepID=A0AAD9WH01_9HELO|nr:hypothetical protein QTJ16_000733 [Diplocarpon rosae]